MRMEVECGSDVNFPLASIKKTVYGQKNAIVSVNTSFIF